MKERRKEVERAVGRVEGGVGQEGAGDGPGSEVEGKTTLVIS